MRIWTASLDICYAIIPMTKADLPSPYFQRKSDGAKNGSVHCMA